jgi:hypothetical protein
LRIDNLLFATAFNHPPQEHLVCGSSVILRGDPVG